MSKVEIYLRFAHSDVRGRLEDNAIMAVKKAPGPRLIFKATLKYIPWELWKNSDEIHDRFILGGRIWACTQNPNKIIFALPRFLLLN